MRRGFVFFMLSLKSRRLHGALREFLEAADCEASIVTGGNRGQPGDSTLTSGASGIMTAAIHEAGDFQHGRPAIAHTFWLWS